VDDIDSALQLAREGDRTAQRVFSAAADYVAQALGPLISILNPDLVLIGGDRRSRTLRRRPTTTPESVQALHDGPSAAGRRGQRRDACGEHHSSDDRAEDNPDLLLGYLQPRIRRARNAA
jgi:predicted NBD/HSP70 family sugar kinase